MLKEKVYKKNKVIFISIWPITNYSLKRIDIKSYKKNFDIELHDLGLFINAKFSNLYKKEEIKFYKVYKFKSYGEWFKRILILKKKYKKQKILILSEISINGIKSFICELTLKLFNSLVIKMEQPGNPIVEKRENETNSNSKELRKDIFKKKINFHKKLFFFFQTFSVSLFLGKKMYILTVPNRVNSCRKLYPFSKIINGSTYDYSNYLISRNKSSKKLINKRYALYIDGARPHIIGDEFIIKQKVTLTPENWYPRLNHFFDLLESKLKLKVIIAGHPKTENTGLEDRFDGRKVIFNQTKELIKDCEFIATRISTAISYAVIYNKKIFFIQTKELFKDKYFNFVQESYLNTFNQKALFIDGDSEEIIQKIKSHKINKSLYKEFINKNLTGIHSSTNYQIINEIFEKLNQKFF